jgi:hypothetical protein
LALAAENKDVAKRRPEEEITSVSVRPRSIWGLSIRRTMLSVFWMAGFSGKSAQALLISIFHGHPLMCFVSNVDRVTENIRNIYI